MTDYLNNINSPADLKKLSVEQLPDLAEEIRQALLSRLMVTGGHAGPNLGMVEATIALHYVFDSPTDKFVFDVSHQCYVHKILTGRKDGFTDPERYGAYSGYTNPSESEHDMFTVGHTATALSLATGLAAARDLKGESGNVVAIVGDGSMSGGEAFEGLNNASMLGSNFILLFNDNEIAISPNYGGMYQNFAALRETNGTAECNFFKSFGMDYCYVSDGNNVLAMVEALQKVKDTDHPVVVHIHTEKGKGLSWNKANLEGSHFVMPGGVSLDDAMSSMEFCGSIMAEHLLQKIKKDPTVIAISPATPGQSFLTPDFRQKAGMQFIDVGIAEEHAVAFASGLAKNGAKPVLCIVSSFMQRTFDQLLLDLSLDKSPATILVGNGGINPGDATHCGVYDIAMLNSIPNLICLAPTTKEEYLAMFDWALEQTNAPVVIREPSAVVSAGREVTFTDADLGCYDVAERGAKVAFIGLGNFFHLAGQAKTALKEKTGIEATVINPRIYSTLDEKMLESLKAEHEIIVTLEDGVLAGGFGQRIASFYGPSSMKVLNYGAAKEFRDRIPVEVQYQRDHLTPEQIVQDIEACL